MCYTDEQIIALWSATRQLTMTGSSSTSGVVLITVSDDVGRPHFMDGNTSTLQLRSPYASKELPPLSEWGKKKLQELEDRLDDFEKSIEEHSKSFDLQLSDEQKLEDAVFS